MTHSSAPSATVIVPTFNRADLLRLTLTSLSAQSRSDFEVIVVDDGSTDRTRAVVDEFTRALRLTYVFQPDEGFRVARARNLGIRLADSPICVFVDSGVVMHRTSVDRHVEVQAGEDVVVGRLLGFSQDNSSEEELVRLWTSLGEGSRFSHLEGREDFQDPRDHCLSSLDVPFGSWPAPWALFWTANASAPTQMVLEAGGFDEAYTSWGVEDVDLGYRLHRSGARYRWAHDAVGFHHPHDKPQHSRRVSADSNRHYFASKFPGDTAVQLLTTHRAVCLNHVLLGELPSMQGVRT
ncbi:glycosyltransferase [Cellulomonas cellasea]|uniref:Uncharacterized protein n=2 Tax=Cellulomonas cellasea TaxID=43670 RepID=A0A0A0BCI0_9CELL|nr:glycosyltransferase [Cellulomonas cellasea]KGM03888.1 hypothetical protein Q760_07800 [Cellulomonas cellasea DSM 20118]GEA87337.1 glycosyl transferase [Cellulomonas cellasea]